MRTDQKRHDLIALHPYVISTSALNNEPSKPTARRPFKRLMMVVHVTRAHRAIRRVPAARVLVVEDDQHRSWSHK